MTLLLASILLFAALNLAVGSVAIPIEAVVKIVNEGVSKRQDRKT